MTDASGLLYMRARYYNPNICRFVNPDPAGFAGGLNWYAFADGNPISLLDPFGLGAIEGWGGSTATWVNRHLVNPLNSVSTTSTTLNFASYMAASIIGGMGDMLRLGQGTGDAAYNADSGWDVAIGITQDIQRAAGITTLVAGGLEGFAKGPRYGDLTAGEVRAIQAAVDETGQSVTVVGSAARGSRRGVGTDTPVGKGPGTRSDIDYVVEKPYPEFPSALDDLDPLVSKLPDVNPGHGPIRGTYNPYEGPGIHFEPGRPPTPKPAN
jgi:hypothetical protein